MGKTKYDDLMRRWLTDRVTETERIRIEAWLDSIKEQDADDLEMTDEEAEVLFDKITSSQDNIAEIRSFRPASIRRRARSRWIFRIAASLFVVAVATFTIWTLTGKGTDDALAEIRKISLHDGSLVWIRGDSRLSYSENSSGRFVNLEGEALFEVTKDPARPFTISYKDINVRVTGTSFSLKTGDSIQLIVLTGTVNISSASDKDGENVTKNEKAIYTMESGIRKFPLLPNEARAATADTEYDMHFTNATFNEIVERLEGKFDVEITLSDDTIGECHLNLDITDHSLDSSLRMITSVLNVEYQVNGEEILFTGTGCK